MKWKIKESTQKKVERFNISVDQVVLPDGEERIFSYMDGGKGVCILPITESHEIVGKKQYRHAVKSVEWELPAGMIQTGDLEPLDAAKKQLLDETGFTADHWLELGSFYPSSDSTTEEIFLFAAAGLSMDEQSKEKSEQLDIHTITMEELKELIVNGQFKQGAGLATVLRYKFMVD